MQNARRFCGKNARITYTLDFKTAHTIATSRIHSKLDYCNSLFFEPLQSQLNRLQLILNSTARAVSKTPKFSPITPVLKSLHWLKIEQRIQYKVISITYKTPIQQAYISQWPVSYPAQHEHSFLWHYLSPTSSCLLSSETNQQILHSPCSGTHAKLKTFLFTRSFPPP